MKLYYLIPIVIVSVGLAGTGSYFLADYIIRKNTKIPVYKKVERQNFLGTWYELYRLDNNSEKGLNFVTVEYTQKKGYIEVLTSGYNNKTKKEKKDEKNFIQKAYAKNKENSKFKIYSGIIGKYYWVSLLDEENIKFNWMVISNPYGSSFWILSKNKSLNIKEKALIFGEAKKWGIKTEKLVEVKQTEI